MNDLTERLRRVGAILDQASEQGVRRTPPLTHGQPGRQAPAAPSTTEDSGPYIARPDPVHGSSRKLRLAIAAAVVLIAGGIYLGAHRLGPLQRSSPGPVEVVPTVRRNGNTTVLRLPGRSVELWISPNPAAAPKTGTCGNAIARGSTSEQCGTYGQNQLSGLFRTRDLPDGATKASRYLQIINLDRRITLVKVRDGDRTMYEAPTAGAALFPLNGPYPGFTITGTDRGNQIVFKSHPN